MNEQELLERWYDTKQQISALEDKIEKYKKIADNIMDHKNTDILSSDSEKRFTIGNMGKVFKRKFLFCVLYN